MPRPVLPSARTRRRLLQSQDVDHKNLVRSIAFLSPKTLVEVGAASDGEAKIKTTIAISVAYVIVTMRH